MSVSLKTEGGSWLDWRDAWREMGRTEGEIAAEDAARAAAAEAREFVKGAAQAARAARARTRFATWGATDARIVRMKARLAPLASYFLSAFRSALRGADASWTERALRGEPMTLRRLYEAATCNGVFGARDAATRWRDFGRVLDWVQNALRGAARAGFSAAEAELAARWASADADVPLTVPADFTDTRARESLNVIKKPLHDTAPAEAGFSPLAPTPLVGAGACNSKGEAFADEEGRGLAACAGGSGTEASADGAGAQRVARWTARTFPRRLWWLVWKHYGAFRELHFGKAVKWSGAHYVAWMKSCLAAGKRVGDLYQLYDEKLLRWHGLACDWRIAQRSLHPKGLFAELYRAAAALPDFRAAAGARGN